jgi:hypothetical protein
MSILKMVMFEYQEKKMTNLQIDTVSSLAFMLQFPGLFGDVDIDFSCNLIGALLQGCQDCRLNHQFTQFYNPARVACNIVFEWDCGGTARSMRFFYHFAIPKRGIVCKNHLCVFVSA